MGALIWKICVYGPFASLRLAAKPAAAPTEQVHVENYKYEKDLLLSVLCVRVYVSEFMFQFIV